MEQIELTNAQVEAIAMLAGGLTMREAAESSGVDRNTFSNWLTLPEFQQAIEQAAYWQEREVREHAIALVPQAYAVLAEILANAEAPHGVRAKAALAIIDRSTRPLPDPPEELEILHNSAQAPTKNQPLTSEQPAQTRKVAHYELCPCGSGTVYKYCCLDKPGLKPTAA